VLGIIAAVIVVIGLAWVLIEVIVPVVAVLLYALVRGMLARVANDKHGCGGKSGASLLWGALWATVYTVPLAFLTWVVHLIVVYNRA
jgi:hypothetical protein